jgi:methionyl-tRNA formyltransferase
MRVVFFGTPAFAVPSLAALARRHEVTHVLTHPDRPHGRSRSTLVPPPVKTTALLPASDCCNPSGRSVIPSPPCCVRPGPTRRGRRVQASSGRTCSPFFARGMINIHASLLPRWRGAAPVQAAILAGDPMTGVSVMQMEAGLDSGPVFLKQETPIGAT